MKYLISLIITCFVIALNVSFAQNHGGMGGGKGGPKMDMNVGHFYGKVLDSASGKGVEYAIVELFGNKFDTTAKKLKFGLLAGELTKENGEFSLEKLPVMGEFTLKISSMGYTVIEKKVSFNVDFEKMKSGGGMSSMLNMVDKDLGNFKLKGNVQQLKTVEIVSEEAMVEIKPDKKVFNVEKNLNAAGGSAEDVLKNVPSVTVDMDGNVSMRNASPQIFVDGRPTTLTLDQIPADAIQSIEVISNPSAKYDAGSGMAGIINIVLKKNRKFGYNGTVRGGIDQRGRFNSGADINAREGKINLFGSLFFNQRMHKGFTNTVRENYYTTPTTRFTQTDPNQTKGFFAMARGGVDYFIDNRNTLTFSQNLGMGEFKNTDSLYTITDSIFNNYTSSSEYQRNSMSGRNFKNMGSSLQYKHLFPKEGQELTADLNFNANKSESEGNFITQYVQNKYEPIGNAIYQKQIGKGSTQFITAQTDYVHPVNSKMKLEAGFRVNAKNFLTENNNYYQNGSEWIILPSQTVKYNFGDQVVAAYSTLNHEVGKIAYQAGLRLESFFYKGIVSSTNSEYSYRYPIMPFPSISATYHLPNNNDIQMSLTRKVNRPNFFQLIPVVDYSDSLNLKRGNANLKPEFTNSAEINYLKNYNRNDNFMISGYFKYITNIITNYQQSEYNDVLQREVLVMTYKNALSSTSYGSEITAKNSWKKWIETTLNVNVYNTAINATNIDASLQNQQFSWFGKANVTFKLPANTNIQLTSEYQSKTNMPVNQSGGGRWSGMGGGGHGGGAPMGGGGGMHGGIGTSGPTSQGYILPFYVIDLSVKKDFLKNKNLSVTLSGNDLLKTKINRTSLSNSSFKQETERRRDQLFFKLNINYKFGKFDASLFKRKNTKVNSEGMDMGM